MKRPSSFTCDFQLSVMLVVFQLPDSAAFTRKYCRLTATRAEAAICYRVAGLYGDARWILVLDALEECLPLHDGEWWEIDYGRTSEGLSWSRGTRAYWGLPASRSDPTSIQVPRLRFFHGFHAICGSGGRWISDRSRSLMKEKVWLPAAWLKQHVGL